MFLVANIKQMPKTMYQSIEFHKFMASLPEKAIAGDVFLGMSYYPNSIPYKVEAYFS